MSYGKVNKTTGERIPYAGNSSGGTSDYTDLTNKPSINNVTLSGNKTASDLSLASTTDLAGKQDNFERISYANWQLLTPQQQAAKPYYIYDYPSSAITARNVAYDNTSSGMSADDVQEAVDELKSGLTSVTNFELINSTFYSDVETGVSVNNTSCVTKCGKHIVGDVVLTLDNNLSVSLTNLLKLAYRPKNSLNTFCAAGTSAYTVNGLLHMWVSYDSGAVIVENTASLENIRAVKIHLDYYTDD